MAIYIPKCDNYVVFDKYKKIKVRYSKISTFQDLICPDFTYK